MCLLPFPLKVWLHKGSQVQAHRPSPESSIQHNQFGFDVQVQFACDFEGRLLVLPLPPTVGDEIWGRGAMAVLGL